MNRPFSSYTFFLDWSRLKYILYIFNCFIHERWQKHQLLFGIFHEIFLYAFFLRRITSLNEKISILLTYFSINVKANAARKGGSVFLANFRPGFAGKGRTAGGGFYIQCKSWRKLKQNPIILVHVLSKM